MGPEPGHLQSGSGRPRSCPWLLVRLGLKAATSLPPEAPQLRGDLRTGLSSRNSLSALGRAGAVEAALARCPRRPAACRPRGPLGIGSVPGEPFLATLQCLPLPERTEVSQHAVGAPGLPALLCCVPSQPSLSWGERWLLPRASWEEATAIPGCGPWSSPKPLPKAGEQLPGRSQGGRPSTGDGARTPASHGKGTGHLWLTGVPLIRDPIAPTAASLTRLGGSRGGPCHRRGHEARNELLESVSPRSRAAQGPSAPARPWPEVSLSGGFV